jgi:ABC-2 type transport system ATP-binding protein
VLESLNFSVPPGGIVGLAGANGCGKSTCFRLLAGHLTPDTGRVLVNGRPAGDIARLTAEISILGDMVGLPTGLTVGRSVRAMTNLLALDRRGLAEAVDALGLRAKWREPVARLSRGWQQRVKLAVALAGAGSVLVLYEPTNGLDANSKEWLTRALSARRDNGSAIVIVTHEFPELEKLADQIVVLRRHAVYAGPMVTAEHYAELLDVA